MCQQGFINTSQMAQPASMNTDAQHAFQAFTTEVVVDNFPRSISSLCLWQEQLLVGLQDGSLLFFQQKHPATSSDTTTSWQVVKANRDVERKSVLQMVPVVALPSPTGSPSAGTPRLSQNGTTINKHLLLSLTEDGVNVRTLPDGMLRYQAMGTKGATCMAWSVQRGQLAVGLRRRVLLFELRTRERPGGGSSAGVTLEQVLDAAAPDTPASVMWAGDSLFLASKKGYYVMLTTPSTAPAAGDDGAGTPKTPSSTALQLQPGDLCGVGSAINPCMAHTVAGGEIMLARGNQLVCVDERGQPTRRQPITFTEPIIGVGSGLYHVVVLLPSGVEVRSLQRTGGPHVVQSLPSLMEARMVTGPGATGDGSLFLGMAGDRGVRRLVPVPLATQAEQLARAGEYEEALTLVTLLSEGNAPSTSADTRTEVEDRLRGMYAHHLLSMGDYDEGMAQLRLCRGGTGQSQSALVLLRFLPSLVPSKFRQYLPDVSDGTHSQEEVSEPVGEAFAAAASYALPYLTSYRSRTMAAHPELVEARLAWAAQDSGRSDPVTVPTQQPSAPATPRAGSNPDCTGAADTTSAPPAGPNPVPPMALGDTEGFHSGPLSAELSLVIVDTAMVVAMLAQREDTGTLLRFVQQSPNWVDLQEGERLLREAGRYAELAALYKYHGQHDQALEVLLQCSQSPDTLQPPATGAAADLVGLPGVWAAVRYLTHLGTEQAELIRKHSGWILGADPEAGLQAFLQMRHPLQPSLALDILHTHSPQYSSMYLESALQMGVAAPQDYHSELLVIYLQEMLDREDTDTSSLEEDRTSDTGARRGQAAALSEVLPPLPGLSATGLPTSPEVQQLPNRLRRSVHATHKQRRSAKATGTPASVASTTQDAAIHEDMGHAKALSDSESGPHAASRGGRRKRRRRGSPTALSLGNGFGSLPTGAVSGPWPLFPEVWKTPAAVAGTESPQTGHKGQDVTGVPLVHPSSCSSTRPPVPPSSTAPTPPDSPDTSDTDSVAPRGPSPAAQRPAAGTMTPSTPPRTPAGMHTPTSKPPSSAQDLQVAMDALWQAAPVIAVAGVVQTRGPQATATTACAPTSPVSHGPGTRLTEQTTQPSSSSAPTSNQTAQLSASAASSSGASGPLTMHAPPKMRRRPLYQRLRELVFSSPYLDPEHVLSKLPPGELPEIRALMLERLGQHLEALRLYVHVLADTRLAEAYCDRVYASETKQRAAVQDHGGSLGPVPRAMHPASTRTGVATPCEPSVAPEDIYLLFLQVVLEGNSVVQAAESLAKEHSVCAGQVLPHPTRHPAADSLTALAQQDLSPAAALEAAGAPPLWRDTVWVLARKVSRLAPQRVLDALPPSLPVAWTLPFLEAALMWAADARRTADVTRQLRRSENLLVKEAVGGERAGRVHLSAERACAICYRRIGLAAFVAYPDLSLAHYQCHKRKHPHEDTCVLQPPTPAYPMQPLTPAMPTAQQVVATVAGMDAGSSISVVDRSTHSSASGPGSTGVDHQVPPLPVSLPASRGDSRTGSGHSAPPRTRMPDAEDQRKATHCSDQGEQTGTAQHSLQQSSPTPVPNSSTAPLAIPPSLLQ